MIKDTIYKVQDHCHYTRKCRGAAHNIYNKRNFCDIP